MYLLDDHFLEMISEAEETQRWQDDGGTSDKETAPEMGDKMPLPLVKP